MNKKPNTLSTSWGGVADWYDDLLEQNPDSFQEKVILPNLSRIIEPKVGLSIFDIACGQGYFTRAFGKTGATVAGADISKELIDIAREHSSKDITYFVAPAETLATLVNKKMLDAKDTEKGFDVAIIVLAIQNIKDIKTTFTEAFRILNPSGRLVIVINHPAFRIPKKSSWIWDEKTNSQFRRIDAYMSDNQTEIDMNPGKTATLGAAKSTKTISFHRPLQSYFKALSSAGFAITRLEEWISHKQSQTGPRATEEDRIRKEIPMFMCIEAKKI